jgi:DNA-binding transcriptional LysR family regulator
MELRHLRYFVAVAEELHFGRAAQRLAISQPPLSQQIQTLESELEAKLFDRSRRQVRLTRAGTAFLGHARQILAAVEVAVGQVREAHQGKSGTLRLAHISGAAFRLLPDAINRHRRRFPTVTVSCQIMELAAMQLETLRSGAIDLGIVRLPFAAEGLVVKELGSEPMVLAVPAGDPLARRREIAWSELRGVPFVWYPRQAAPELYDEHMAFMLRHGITPQVAIEAPHIMLLLAYVAAGLGVCLVLESATAIGHEGVRYVRLKTPPRVRTGVAYRPDAYQDLVPEFVATLRECVRVRASGAARRVRRLGASQVTAR